MEKVNPKTGVSTFSFFEPQEQPQIANKQVANNKETSFAEAGNTIKNAFFNAVSDLHVSIVTQQPNVFS